MVGGARMTPLILAINIGNTNVSSALFQGKKIVDRMRVPTASCDSQAFVLRTYLSWLGGDKIRQLEGICISNVVPSYETIFRRLGMELTGREPLFAMPKTVAVSLKGYDPHQVGADRLVNALAAFSKYRKSAIVIDAGSCITFNAVTNKGEFVGGAIVPGLKMAAKSLNSCTARLPHVELKAPSRKVGRSTEECIRTGLINGYAGLVDRLVSDMTSEMKVRPLVIATGGDCELLSKLSKSIKKVDRDLTFEGIRLVWELNRGLVV